jgi:hypothetical protein
MGWVCSQGNAPHGDDLVFATVRYFTGARLFDRRYVSNCVRLVDS